MSDYMFMLESVLNAEQNRVLEQVQTAAAEAGISLFLAGGGMRDMLSGVRIRDLDFTLEGNALKVVKALEESAGARVLRMDENRRCAELLFPDGVQAQIAMARKERYAKTGAKPQVTPATIQEDLRGRDFTVNAMALSLNRASRGLLLDPTNGLADLGHKEMRSTNSYVFYDDPSRMLRLVRLRVRLGFAVEERTRTQFDNAREAKVQELIPPRVLGEELKAIAGEPVPSDVLAGLETEGLLTLFSPALTGGKLNLPGIVKLEKAQALVDSAGVPATPKFPAFLHALTGKLSPKEKAALLKGVEVPKAELDLLKALEPRAKKLEAALKASGIRKPSQVYLALADAPGDLMAFLLCHSTQKVAPDRIRAYLQKYLPMIQEIPESDWAAIEGEPGTPKYRRNRQAFVAARLDVKPPKPEEQAEVVPAAEPAPAPVEVVRGRRG